MVLLKTLSWAVVSGIIIGITTYVETGCVRAAIVTALVASTLKTPIYSVHEMVWNRIKHAVGRSKANPQKAEIEVKQAA